MVSLNNNNNNKLLLITIGLSLRPLLNLLRWQITGFASSHQLSGCKFGNYSIVYKHFLRHVNIIAGADIKHVEIHN